ncbi:MAG: hypothetical protein FH756_06150 [Firmicutes bacterium]|nr:hypothetical protein [Bacillota bacterium]
MKTIIWDSPLLWKIGLLIVISLLSILIYKFYPFVIANWLITIPALTTLISTFLWLHKTFQPVYRFFAKAKAMLLHTQTIWNLNADFEGEKINEETFNKLRQKLLTLGNRHTILNEHEYQFDIQIEGLNILTRFGFDEGKQLNEFDFVGHINLQIIDYHAPYYSTLTRLQAEVIPLLEVISNLTGASNQTFKLGVVFEKTNPFLGLYAMRIPKSQLLEFNCVFESPSALKNISLSRVEVWKNEVNFQTRDISSLQSLINKYLALSGG